MDDLPPSHRYYRHNHGSWTCPFELTIHDWAAFRAAPIGLMDRLRVLSLHLLQRLFGPPTMETTVDYHTAGPSRGEVVHTTTVRTWGLATLRSVEVFTLHPDGVSVGVRGEQRLWPTPWRAVGYGDSSAVVDVSGLRATYDLVGLGGRFQQVGEIRPEGTWITMDFGWGGGVQRLRRAVGSAAG